MREADNEFMTSMRQETRGDTADWRRMNRDALSLALIDARNRSLAWLACAEQATQQAVATGATGDASARFLAQVIHWTAHAGWFQERWIARNPRRAQGRRSDAGSPLASIEPGADLWWSDPGWPADRIPAVSAQQARAYLLESLETTLELLERAPPGEEGLYLFRCALGVELQRTQRLLEHWQAVQWPLAREHMPELPGGRASREPLAMPAAAWLLGSGPEEFHPDDEGPRTNVKIPEFEVDAQLVTWAQYAEFVADSGYDRRELWSDDGWAWLQALAHGEGRRAPGHVEQIGAHDGSVLQQWFGHTRRMGVAQPAAHVSWWEAQAWCRWAGRRMVSEVEWEYAAHVAGSRGFAWGDLWEWTGTTYRAYGEPFEADPWHEPATQRFDGTRKVLRGACFATPQVLRHPKARRAAWAGDDAVFAGFRSCAW